MRSSSWTSPAVAVLALVSAVAAADVRVELADTVKSVGPTRSRGRGWYASYRLEVPRGARLRLQADNGGLHLQRFAGEADLHTVNGGLHLEEVGGHVQGETVNGGIHLEFSGTEWQGQGLDLAPPTAGCTSRSPPATTPGSRRARSTAASAATCP